MSKDVLDHVAITVTQKINDDRMLKAVLEAIEETRALYQGEQYIRKDNPKEKFAFRLWQQQKHTNKTMQEIYEYISCQIDLSPKRIEYYITKFIKGHNPYVIGE